jgi:hypothetical protein
MKKLWMMNDISDDIWWLIIEKPLGLIQWPVWWGRFGQDWTGSRDIGHFFQRGLGERYASNCSCKSTSIAIPEKKEMFSPTNLLAQWFFSIFSRFIIYHKSKRQEESCTFLAPT